MKSLKQLPKILFCLIILLTFHSGLANTSGKVDTKGKNQNALQQQDQNGNRIEGQRLDEEPSMELEITEEELVDQDSVSDDSVSKYNFIFYFLYKYKYQQQEEEI